jgi:transposase-like protein
MSDDTPSPLNNVITIDDERIKSHLDRVVRGTVEETLNALLDAEADQLCNAQRYERSAARRDTRAGHYERGLQTKAGEVRLRVPKLRRQTFETAIIERYRRRESSVEEALIEMYLAGVSVRRVEDITEALWGTRVSPSTVSNLNKKIYGTIETWRNRPIEGEHPYVYLDGIVLKRSWAGEVRNVSLLVAIGVNESGYREILGICEGAKEDKTGWSAFLKHLKERGLKGVRLITSDACIGLAESAAEFFPEAAWQRCIVHWYRNIFSHVPSTKVREIAAMLKAIHAGEDIAAAREKAIRVIEKLRGLRLSRAAELVEMAVEETLTYYAFPEEHWRRIRTNNPLERILREIRRRTRVVGAFPDGQSALNLAAARLRHIAGTAWSTKISQHRATQGPADERCHHRVSQGRVPLSQTESAKDSGHYLAGWQHEGGAGPAFGTYGTEQIGGLGALIVNGAGS